MYAAYFVFLLLWIAYAWSWKEMEINSNEDLNIQIEAPLFKQDCTEKEIPCIDDCSFLCIERDAECVGGICESRKGMPPCNEKTGGMRVLVKDPVPQWSCVCTDARFYGGKACDELNVDVCEHGSFHYFSRKKFTCICPLPYKLIKTGTTPHCVEERMLNFYDEWTKNKNKLV